MATRTGYQAAAAEARLPGRVALSGTGVSP
jgi:hypothetical protein